MMTISATLGIYEIRNKITGHCYIGSSIDMRNRKYRHILALRRGEHHSPHLQNAWDKYGEDAFEFRAIEDVVDISLLLQREQYWIDTRHPKYNINQVANSRIGLTNSSEQNRKIAVSHLGLKHKAESLEKMRLAKEGKKQSEEIIQARVAGMMGHEVSESARLKSAESNRAVWAQRTPEERHRIATNRPPVSDGTRQRQSESHLGKTQDKGLVEKRIQASWGSKTEEERAEIIAKRKATIAAKQDQSTEIV